MVYDDGFKFIMITLLTRYSIGGCWDNLRYPIRVLVMRVWKENI